MREGGRRGGREGGRMRIWREITGEGGVHSVQCIQSMLRLKVSMSVKQTQIY